MVAFAQPGKVPLEPVFEQRFERLPDGIWVGTYTRLNPSVNPDLFNQESYDWIVETKNYRRFGTESGELKQVRTKTP